MLTKTRQTGIINGYILKPAWGNHARLVLPAPNSASHSTELDLTAHVLRGLADLLEYPSMSQPLPHITISNESVGAMVCFADSGFCYIIPTVLRQMLIDDLRTVAQELD